MRVNLEEVSQLERKMSVEIPTEQVSKAFDRIYKSIQESSTIKGFRKGKAPLATIKSLYSDKVKGDVVSELVQKHYAQALDEKKLEPINYPNIQVSELDEAKPFSFTAIFEVRPEVSLAQYEGLPVDKEKLELDPKHFEKVLENIRTNHAQFETVLEDRAAQNGDFLTIDFEGFRDGQSVANTKADDFQLELGSASFIPGFEEGLVGVRVGQERTLDLTFPTEYHSKDLAGSPITFKVKVKELKKKVLPEVNDEFAKKVGFESYAKMVETIEADFKNSEEKRINDEFKNRLLKSLVTRNPVAVPKSMKDEQKKLIIQDVTGRLQQQGLGEREVAEYVEKWNSDFEDSAAFMIQSSFLVNAISQKESLNATAEDFQKKLEEYAQQTGLEVSKLLTYYSEGESRSRMMYRITEDKVIGFLTEKAKIREVSKDSLKD